MGFSLMFRRIEGERQADAYRAGLATFLTERRLEVAPSTDRTHHLAGPDGELTFDYDLCVAGRFLRVDSAEELTEALSGDFGEFLAYKKRVLGMERTHDAIRSAPNEGPT